MVKKSLVVSVFLFLVFNLLLFKLNFPANPQHQWQNNIITAQEYIYNHNEIKYAIVGTSLSDRLDDKLLPKNCFNLAFGGQGAIDGLEIIKRSNARPEAVFIESNAIFKKPRKSFLDNLFMPVMYSLRNYLPALMEKNQPVCILRTLSFWSAALIKKKFISNEKDAKINYKRKTDNKKNCSQQQYKN